MDDELMIAGGGTSVVSSDAIAAYGHVDELANCRGYQAKARHTMIRKSTPVSVATSKLIYQVCLDDMRYTSACC